MRLGINLDHIATIRNARGEDYPSPLRGASIAADAGADNITLHLREDRRHVRDDDLFQYHQATSLPLNMEMAATAEMQQIALKIQPHTVTLVPEKREERTTEGGLDALAQQQMLTDFLAPLKQAGIKTALFIEPDTAQIECAKNIGVDAIEIHTGRYAQLVGDAHINAQQNELRAIAQAADYTISLGLGCHAGHGLTYDNVGAIAAIPAISELNIGHFIISEAIFLSLKEAILQMRTLIDKARAT